MSVFDEYTQRMTTRFPFRVARALPCPRVVAGRRCRYQMSEGEESCVCEKRRFRILDHGRLWVTTCPWNGRVERVLTSEPYDFELADLDVYRGALATAGLPVRVFVMEQPVWHPTTTLILTLREDSCLLPMHGVQFITYIEGV